MKNILTVAKREITRLRSRFTGKSRPVVTLILLGSFLITYLAFRQGAVRGRGLYRIGVNPGSPHIDDSRFDTVNVDRSSANSMLETGAINAYIDGDQVVHRDEEKSLYAVAALKLYLEVQELARVEAEHEMDTGFPLRVGVNYFPIDLSADDEIMIPSLMSPPLPFAQVVTVSIYVLPIFFVSVFFTSGFMNEKKDRRITVLLSAPVTPFQIIVGKMLPYMIFALAFMVVLTLIMKGNLLLAIVIFIPVILFIFSIYLIVPLVYRTFKDTTFISMLATTVIMSYLVFPAMFSGINDLSYISPLTLAIKMYRGQPFGLKEYLTSTASMYLVFILTMYVGSRVLNEEYLMKFRPLYRKVADAIYLALNRKHIHLSVTLLSLFLIPIVYMIQLVTLAVALNLPIRIALVALLIMSVIIEEITKSAGITVLIENRDVKTAKDIIVVSFLSALGFLVGEKLLLFVSVGIVSESMLSAAVFNVGKLWIPLVAHFFFTSIVCLLTLRFGAKRYPFAVLAGSAVHVVYNLSILFGMMG
ncbi:MAG: ABC transporter permease [Chloroflexi bacterium]|nr:ABC transporter permease [Chloroflexota bacterium]